MHTRQNALNKWLQIQFDNQPFTLTSVAGDASFRRYFRVHCGQTTRIVMDAPPEKEATEPFLRISRQLASVGVHTPNIYAVESTEGFVLLEDLGDHLLLKALSPERADSLYSAAIETLLKIQTCPTTYQGIPLPIFDQTFMLQEIALFREWFLNIHLKLTLTASEEQLLLETFQWLTTQIAAQPHVFIHRDYHARNLMLIEHPQGQIDLGVIDYQDAMQGPWLYDLVSLLKDCYIQWPRERIMQWLSAFHQKTSSTHPISFDELTRAFDLCGLQRHLKVLGIFCRLHWRDHKSTYLHDLPLTLHYVTACLESYPELQTFYQWMQTRVLIPFSRISAP